MKNVVLLGSTGSIGRSTLQVLEDIPDRIRIVGMAARDNVEALAGQARKLRPRAVAIANPAKADWLRDQLDGTVEVHAGQDGLVRLATMPEAEIVLIAIVGTAGLAPALAAVRAGKTIAVASKEILVLAGEVVMAEARRHGANVLPVDSEHNAIFQCLEGRNRAEVSKLILTASGGPFRDRSIAELERVTVAEALKHPTWNMGRKITIDSATLFNKGLEMIEARWLFGMPMNKVEVIVHPQSIVHSMVEFVDGSVLAQLSVPNMRYPIQYALTYPDRLANSMQPTNFAQIGQLTFEAPDPVRFPALRLAREAGERGGTLPAVLNAANEIAVDRFLSGHLTFPRIWEVVDRTLAAHKTMAHPGLESLLEADEWARQEAARCCDR